MFNPSSSPNQNDTRWLPRFVTIWAGQAASQFGSHLAQFALVWWITLTTQSAVALTTATLVAILPSVVVMPFAGALVDRWNRRRVMLVTDTLSAVVAFVLAGLFVAEVAQLWHVYAAIFVRSILGAFQMPAMQASTSMLVPEAHLTRIGGMNQMLQGAIGIFAPAGGALMLSIAPISAAMAIDVLTALMAVLPLLIVAIPQPARQAAPGAHLPGPALLHEMREGFAVLAGNRGLVFIAVMSSLLNFLLTPTGALAPLLITRHFAGGAPELALLEGAGGIGLVLGGLVMSAWGGFKRRIYTTIVGAVGIGTGIAVIGFAPAAAFGMAVAGMFLASVMQALANGSVMAIFQSVIPKHAQGRVMALLGTAAMGISPLSLLIAGPLAETFGPRAWYIGAGLISILVSLSGLLSRDVRALGAPSTAAKMTVASQVASLT
ncbi:MAG TPA: MFS transporter [Thermoflexales bacterium]|nr:MFS transporter [Anaerolineae bacterium]HQX10050.1 MFS transporter [Thermoflexales bacterium]HQY24119.1 MFS transporter [Thermoflexales bacterium]HQZ53533.1 MFS transporter [Thermoflexales bacterium]HRA53331.1 MFS transporter [Thermoflexales bacterium]